MALLVRMTNSGRTVGWIQAGLRYLRREGRVFFRR